MLKAEIYLSILAENEEKFLAEIAVAPLVGAWIEIIRLAQRVRLRAVAPLVGAWIEITFRNTIALLKIRRSPRGSVD